MTSNIHFCLQKLYLKKWQDDDGCKCDSRRNKKNSMRATSKEVARILGKMVVNVIRGGIR